MRVLVIGAFGEDVKTLQTRLNTLGAKLNVDGWFGQKTRLAVIQFQQRNNLSADGIVGVNTLRALNLLPAPTPPQFLIIHCSATPERSSGWNAERIVHFHTHILGWGRPGYSRIVEEDGKIVETWQVNSADGIQPFEVTYGTGTHDNNAINICYIGGVDASMRPKDTRTNEQIESLKKIILDIVKMHPNIQVLGHNQISAVRACPCFSVPQFCEEIGLDDKNIYKLDPFGTAKSFEKKKKEGKE